MDIAAQKDEKGDPLLHGKPAELPETLEDFIEDELELSDHAMDAVEDNEQPVPYIPERAVSHHLYQSLSYLSDNASGREQLSGVVEAISEVDASLAAIAHDAPQPECMSSYEAVQWQDWFFEADVEKPYEMVASGVNPVTKMVDAVLVKSKEYKSTGVQMVREQQAYLV